MNLASTYVNAWVNAGFGADSIVSPASSQWVYRNKDSGQMAAAASLGMVNLWDETKLDVLDKYLNAEEEWVKAGAGAWCGRTGGRATLAAEASAASAAESW